MGLPDHMDPGRGPMDTEDHHLEGPREEDLPEDLADHQAHPAPMERIASDARCRRHFRITPSFLIRVLWLRMTTRKEQGMMKTILMRLV